ncbi:MAG: hypothetical protein HGA96_02360 [Desulfobulbaceae bacterium]|nr:hypothetical protein [Desulfobulbaceae bacterium]
MTKIWIHIILVSVFICGLELTTSVAQQVDRSTITYPYYASQERQQQIRDNYRRIEVGMDVKQVESFLGTPDEDHLLYAPKIFNSRQIGHTHWYLIQRLIDRGSVNGKGEQLVRVSFDFKWKVIGVDHWGFDEKNP